MVAAPPEVVEEVEQYPCAVIGCKLTYGRAVGMATDQWKLYGSVFDFRHEVYDDAILIKY